MLGLAFVSCKIEGCTNVEATNYNSEADEDDGTCTYEARISFWFNEGISGWLNTYSVTEISVYVSGELVGSIAYDDWKSGPDCNGENLTTVVELPTENEKNFAYKAYDQTGNEQFAGSITVAPNDCASVQLKY